MKTQFSILLATLVTFNLMGQDSPIEDREIQVEKKYNKEIYAVEPIFDFASINTLPRRSVSFAQDSLVGIAPYTPAVDIKVRPVAYKNTPQEKLHKAFVKLDKGTTNIYHGQGGMVYSAANYFNIKANASFDQWQDNFIEDQNIKKINGALGMTYYINNALKANLDINYDNHSYGRYGGQEVSESNDIQSGYDNIHIDLGINSFRSNPAKWNYGFNVGLNKWNDVESEATENTINLNGSGAFNFAKNTSLLYKPTFIHSTSDVTGDITILDNQLAVTMNTPRAYITIGAQGAQVNSKWEIWPSTNIAWDLFSQHKLNLSSDQNLTPLGAGYITSINPYRSTESLMNAVPLRPDYRAVKVSKNINANYNGALTESISLDISAGYSIITNDLNFQVNNNDLSSFDFDLVDFHVFKSDVQVTKTLLDDKLKSHLSMGYQLFMKESATLWHRPNLSIGTGATYTPIDKLKLMLSGDFNDPQSFQADTEEDSGWKANVSFEARYDVIKNASIYFNADNIANNRYQVWNAHQSFGRNISGGVLIKF